MATGGRIRVVRGLGHRVAGGRHARTARPRWIPGCGDRRGGQPGRDACRALGRPPGAANAIRERRDEAPFDRHRPDPRRHEPRAGCGAERPRLQPSPDVDDILRVARRRAARVPYGGCRRFGRERGPLGFVSRSVDDLVAAPPTHIERVGPSGLAEFLGPDGLLVDIRPAAQRAEEGDFPDAIVIERNVLEWRLDPAGAHRIADVRGLDQPVVVVCSEGYASSLAAASLAELGFRRVADLAGGFRAWARWSQSP